MQAKRMAPLVGLLPALWLAAPAHGDEFLRLADPADYEIQAVGFELTRETDVDIKAVGVRPRHWDDLVVYAWILDAKTRKPVWRMDRRGTKRVKGSRVLREVNTSEKLKAGRYELYLYSGEAWGTRIHVSDGWDWIGRWVGRDDDWGYIEGELDECFVALSADDVSDARRFEIDGGFPNALVRFTKLGDSELVTQGFELKRASNVRVYALIEFPQGDHAPADYGWIVDEKSREVVWQTTKRNSRRAGGGDKNRVFDDEVRLEAGRYILYYGTDDSHSYDEFNAPPPYDPLNWGITLSPGEGMDSGSFQAFEAKTDRGDAVISFVEAGDHDFFEQPFRVKSDVDVRLYALGEYDYDDREFVDYAWIADASGDIAWEMTGHNTIPAGGAEKNRMIDENVRLKKGDYVLYYVTDDSHSYEDWNSATPFDPGAWGVQLFVSSGSKGDIELLSRQVFSRSEDVLVSILRVGDHERVRESFELDEETRLRIYCIGEGTGGDMYDYGYIVDEKTGRDVWEMRYRRTRHAGGAGKNRVFDGEITLGPGRYEATYVSDGSHSFEDWNARKPRDPMNWGLTIRKVK